MKLENQLVNLKLSKKIEKLGVKQDSLWYWCECNNEDFGKIGEWSIIKEVDKRNWKYCSAFTVAELGEMLPEKIELQTHTMGNKGDKIIFELCFGINGDYNKYWVAYGENGILTNHHYIEAKTEADTRAKMLIYLIENDLK